MPKSHRSSQFYPSKEAVGSAFHEVMHNEPKVVAKTRRKKGAKTAHKQAVAISLAKARRR